uniref:Uncharacterized protein n=1 Tax=Onchocerca volvulus TaxID=6282 RepID=A0A8R1XUC0_ONCVO
MAGIFLVPMESSVEVLFIPLRFNLCFRRAREANKRANNKGNDWVRSAVGVTWKVMGVVQGWNSESVASEGCLVETFKQLR